MPELPEVQTVIDTLKLQVLNKAITQIEVFYENIVKTDLADFYDLLPGQHIIDIHRRGKHIIFELDEYYLISHLRMEGKYFIKDKDEELSKHEHVIFYFEDRSTLRYNDTRKFGTMHLLTKDNLYSKESPLSKLGVEPFSNDFTFEYLKPLIMKKTAPIKTVLLDQSVISGIGNIYADEICFRLRLHPSTKANTLSDESINDIIRHTNDVLDKAIKLGGTTIRSYTSQLGVTGRFQNELDVHQQVNKPCKVCNTTIIKIKVGQRGTYLCPNCQK